MLPSTNFDNGTGSMVQGSIMISSTAGESGVMVSVNFSGLPSESKYGPFPYHLHTLPVPADGNCSATLGHLDPTDRGEYYPCNVAAPATCQVGDLAGKHGNITMTNFVTQYADPFLSTDPSSPAFFGDKSVVVHTSNTTRITCANFQMMSASSNGTSTNGSTSPSPSVVPYTGSAANISALGAVGLLAIAAAIL
ncbi:hypothetical protein B0A55_01994 [Friedmanniomyces simplex]|uniref:superoxide dismutase n=1 Tax=Friedmanniomyces simplex TaxID=329884 RepID=A0A4U0XQ15_9PEZI|nr:hypothetical protein B0A55_01994 [Friedmanniomyces simplex]